MMSKSSRDVGKTKKLKQTTMGNFFSFPGTPLKKKHKNSKGKMTSYWGGSSARDTEDYRERYPDKKDDEDLDANVRFYKNEIESKPDGALIEDMLKDWWGDYKRLEQHHGYIQWLFPIREDGMNWHAQELQKHEIEKICEDKEAHARVLKAYKMMLNFYGMKLEDDESGKIERAENWEDRFKHLNKSFHNYLRITRMLKCLGELGYEQLKKPFIEFILHEAMVTKTLPNLLNSCYNYWINVLRDDDERLDMWNLYSHYEQTTESSDEEKIESKKKPKMNNESENSLQSADLKASENGNDTVMEQVEPKQEDNIKQSSPMDNPVELMEVDCERNESNEKPKMKGETENELNSAELKVSENKDLNKEVESKELISALKSDVLMEGKPKMMDESKNELEFAECMESTDEKVMKQEDSIQEDNIEESAQTFDPDVSMETGNANNESNNILKVESENDEKSAKLSASVTENGQGQEESSQEDNIEESTHVSDPGAWMQTDNENKESCKIMKVESENNEKSADFNASTNGKLKKQEGSVQEDHMEESPKVRDTDALMQTEIEKIESSKMLKVESENNDKSANLNASVDEKVNEQEVSSPEGNIEKLTQVDDSYQLLKAGDENNEDGKKLNMKVESENDSVNLKASASREVIEGEALTQEGSVEKVNDPDVLMEAEYQNLKASASKGVIEGEALTQVDSVEKVNNPDVLMEAEYQNLKASASKGVIEGEALTQVDSVEKVNNPDELMEPEYQQVGDNEVTSRHHEQSNSQIDGEKNISEKPVLSKSESVEMIDDNQRWSYDQDKQIDSETPVTRDEQQASLSKKDSVMHDNHSNQEQNREEYQENSCEEKLEAKKDVKANGKL